MNDDNQTIPDVTKQDDGFSLEELDEQASGTIRRVFHDGRWFFSVIDVVGLLTDARNRAAIGQMKNRIHEEKGSVSCWQTVRC